MMSIGHVQWRLRGKVARCNQANHFEILSHKVAHRGKRIFASDASEVDEDVIKNG